MGDYSDNTTHNSDHFLLGHQDLVSLRRHYLDPLRDLLQVRDQERATPPCVIAEPRKFAGQHQQRRQQYASRSAKHGAGEPVVRRACELLGMLRAAELCHGDTKATNFIVAGSEVYLVDLDALRDAKREADYERDAARFLANWEEPGVLARFRDALTGTPG